MDTILDKLSQKLTAQEIIKANSEADAKALERVQGQVQQYNDCLEEMKKVNGQTKMALSEIEKTLQAGLENFKNAEIPTDSITGLVEESLAQIRALQKDSVDVQSALEEKFAKQGEALQAVVEESVSKVNTEVTDYVHKECVKVYRNIQAVQIEENGKQTEELTTQIAKVAGKAKAAWGVSIATLVFSVLATIGVVFELLVMFGILRF
ncbi:MAG: hypothetical protein IJ324_07205 [Lachnospiraceae bacterium]|nr:hypothetical protein [Lachnospiraceae bacterium]